MLLSVLSDDQILNLADESNNPLVKELAKRLAHAGEEPETIGGFTDRDYANHCIGWVGDVSGEDFHQNIIARLYALNAFGRKADRKAEIDGMINTLQEYDLNATNVLSAIRADGVIQ